jgi:phosphatidylserine/phosphatidylglycerophosphate/cardiolipin synthase-like enzyme
MTGAAYARTLTAPDERVAIQELLQALFLAEMLAPSQELWIGSAWLADVLFIDNTGRRYADVLPDAPATMLDLSTVLAALAEKGCSVRVIVRTDDFNHAVLARLRHKREQLPDSTRLGLTTEPDFHEKLIVADSWLWIASMNLTRRGLDRNEEYVRVALDPAEAAELRLKLRGRFGSRFEC